MAEVKKPDFVEDVIDAKDKGAKAMSDFTKRIIIYLGYILSGVGMLGYIVTILVLVRGVPNVDLEIYGKDGWFFIIGMAFGLWIRTGFYIQGIAYAKHENEHVLKEYHNLKVKDKPVSWKASFETKMALSVIISTIFQVITFAVTSIGFVYIAGFEGIKNPIYLASGFSNLIMFTGFGLLALVSTYERYNELKVPVIKERIRRIENEEAEKERLKAEEYKKEQERIKANEVNIMLLKKEKAEWEKERERYVRLNKNEIIEIK